MPSPSVYWAHDTLNLYRVGGVWHTSAVPAAGRITVIGPNPSVGTPTGWWALWLSCDLIPADRETPELWNYFVAGCSRPRYYFRAGCIHYLDPVTYAEIRAAGYTPQPYPWPPGHFDPIDESLYVG